jgi:transposase
MILLDKLTERNSTLNFEYKMYMDQFCLLNEQLNEIDTRIEQKAKELSPEDYYFIMSIPGIGSTIAAAIIAYCNDIIRFKNGRKLTSYIGIVPKIKESGDKKTYSGRITKRGVSILRGYLTQAALCLLRSRNQDVKEIKEWFNKIKVKKGWQKARIALARKLALIIFGVLKNRTKFDPQLIIKKVA